MPSGISRSARKSSSPTMYATAPPTSPPWSASNMPVIGPATPHERSSTRTPSSTLAMAPPVRALFERQDGAGPRRRHERGAGPRHLVGGRPAQLPGGLQREVQAVDV